MSAESWKSIFDGVAVFLLFLTFAAGVGVLVTGNIVNKRQSERLRQFDSDLTNAKTELATQQERAAKAELSIANAHESLKRQEALTANAVEAAEEERIARLHIEAQIAPRRLDATKSAELIRQWTGFKGRIVRLKSYSGDAEAAILGLQIAANLKDAGLKTDLELSSFQSFGNIQLGIAVDGEDSNLVTALVAGLRSAGLAANASPTNIELGGIGMMKINHAPATILIGVKPFK